LQQNSVVQCEAGLTPRVSHCEDGLTLSGLNKFPLTGPVFRGGQSRLSSSSTTKLLYPPGRAIGRFVRLARPPHVRGFQNYDPLLDHALTKISVSAYGVTQTHFVALNSSCDSVLCRPRMYVQSVG